MTIRHEDPVVVGPADFVFEFEDAEDVTLVGRIRSTVAQALRDIPVEQAREDGASDVDDLLRGLRSYYPDLAADDQVVVVRFDVHES